MAGDRHNGFVPFLIYYSLASYRIDWIELKVSELFAIESDI